MAKEIYNNNYPCEIYNFKNLTVEDRYLVAFFIKEIEFLLKTFNYMMHNDETIDAFVDQKNASILKKVDKRIIDTLMAVLQEFVNYTEFSMVVEYIEDSEVRPQPNNSKNWFDGVDEYLPTNPGEIGDLLVKAKFNESDNVVVKRINLEQTEENEEIIKQLKELFDSLEQNEKVDGHA